MLQLLATALLILASTILPHHQASSRGLTEADDDATTTTMTTATPPRYYLQCEDSPIDLRETPEFKDAFAPGYDYRVWQRKSWFRFCQHREGASCACPRGGGGGGGADDQEEDTFMAVPAICRAYGDTAASRRRVDLCEEMCYCVSDELMDGMTDESQR
ncbi:MAG: hypothetical protein M1825_006487 [Sarcosagium campestre]|nr:MAG: hypothetical protein M1825_006487 [Sarcosagium campestre]